MEGFSLTIAILFIYLSSFFAAYALNNTAYAGAALLEGTKDALHFSVELAAALCLWSAVTELLERATSAEARAERLDRLRDWLAEQRDKALLPTTKAIYQAFIDVIDRIKERGLDNSPTRTDITL